MSQELYEWLLIIGRWVHITTAVTWIGTSIFFMWLDRTFLPLDEPPCEGHLGELWMVHGGGFYKVEKLQMGPTKVPPILHWFKWESYWTWMSGMFLLVLIFYTGDGTFLIDESVAAIPSSYGIVIGLASIFGSWFFYDIVWESKTAKESPWLGHLLTIIWLIGITYFLCHTLSGRAAYIHVAAVLGTWMAGNVFLRIIPRQLKMVEASKKGLPVNQDWAKNAKNRSTHNTYFTLPIIFIMFSNHFPSTYGHENNWIIVLFLCLGGAYIREYFVSRLNPEIKSSRKAFWGCLYILIALIIGREATDSEDHSHHHHNHEKSNGQNPHNPQPQKPSSKKNDARILDTLYQISGRVLLRGNPPKGKKLRLPTACAKQHKGAIYSNEVSVKNGYLENVLIRVTTGLENLPSIPIPIDEVEVDQKACIYYPRVSAARVGQRVTFINSDPIFHNVKSVTKANKSFNIAMPKKNQRKTKVFYKPEIFLQTKCSVHPWMRAYVAVMEHGYFAVTGANGLFQLPSMPKGDYTIEAWHETLGTQKLFLSVNGSQKNINITFESK